MHLCCIYPSVVQQSLSFMFYSDVILRKRNTKLIHSTAATTRSLENAKPRVQFAGGMHGISPFLVYISMPQLKMFYPWWGQNLPPPSFLFTNGTMPLPLQRTYMAVFERRSRVMIFLGKGYEWSSTSMIMWSQVYLNILTYMFLWALKPCPQKLWCLT